MLHLLFTATILLAGGPSSAETTLLGRYTLPSENKTYGGFSGLDISDDGSYMVAVSDRTGLVTGAITRDSEGQISDIDVSDPIALNVQSFAPNADYIDAEGVAVADDGTIYVSFEGNHRIGRFATPSAPEELIPSPPEFAAFRSNGGLEAVAIDKDGAIFVMQEQTRRRRDPFPIFRYADGAWSIPFELPRTGDYFVVGADFAPDGLLYVLERQFSGIGFYSRVRRVDLTAHTADVILETGLGVHGNMEGISVWENSAGETIMTLIADDNYRRILKNEIAEYRIDG